MDIEEIQNDEDLAVEQLFKVIKNRVVSTTGCPITDHGIAIVIGEFERWRTDQKKRGE